MAQSFRLSRLLRLRTQLRRLREHEAAALEQQLRSLERETEATRQAQAGAAEEQRRAAETDTLTPGALRLGRDYAEALADAERACRVAMADVSRALTAKRDELTVSHRDESKVRRLEEIHRGRADEAESRLAAVQLDELAIDRHERARRQR